MTRRLSLNGWSEQAEAEKSPKSVKKQWGDSPRASGLRRATSLRKINKGRVFSRIVENIISEWLPQAKKISLFFSGNASSYTHGEGHSFFFFFFELLPHRETPPLRQEALGKIIPYEWKRRF
jgi:hypothetical protein